MRPALLCSLIAALTVPACSSGKGYVSVELKPTGVLEGVAHLRVKVNLAGVDAQPVDVPLPSNDYRIDPEFDFALAFNGRSGVLKVSVDAIDKLGQTIVSSPVADGLVTEGATTTLVVTIGGAPADGGMPDGALPDLATPDLVTTPPDLIGNKNDLVVIPDLVVQPDLSTVSDLVMPQHDFTGMAIPDMAHPDFAMPDLATPDLATPDLATPDLVVAACGAPTFTRSDVANIGSASGVAVADFNGDGILDLAVPQVNGHVVQVMLGTGGGHYGPGTPYARTNNNYAQPVFVLAGDFNYDNHPDFAVSYQGNSGAVLVYINNGSGGFAAPAIYTVASAQWIAQGDINQDGKPDLVVASYSGNSVSVLLGTGGGAFGSPTVIAVGTHPVGVALVDFDGDGKLDIVATNQMDGTVSLLSGNGTTSFTARTPFTVGTTPSSISVADLNRDGHPDLLVANAGSSNISAIINQGSNTATVLPYATTSPPSTAIADDLYGDGNVYVFANGEKAAVDMFSVASDGKLAAIGTIAPTTGAAAGGSGYLAVGDLDGDGKLDLAVSSQAGTGTVSIILSASSSCTAHACLTDLSNLHTGDFSFGFSLKTSSGNGANVALINQRLKCAPFTGWEARLSNGSIDVEVDQAANGTGVPDTQFFTRAASLNDNNQHTIRVTRTSGGLLTVYVDGKIDSAMSGAVQDFGVLPALATGTAVCVGVDGTVALPSSITLSNVCLHD